MVRLSQRTFSTCAADPRSVVCAILPRAGSCAIAPIVLLHPRRKHRCSISKQGIIVNKNRDSSAGVGRAKRFRGRRSMDYRDFRCRFLRRPCMIRRDAGRDAERLPARRPGCQTIVLSLRTAQTLSALGPVFRSILTWAIVYPGSPASARFQASYKRPR